MVKHFRDCLEIGDCCQWLSVSNETLWLLWDWRETSISFPTAAFFCPRSKSCSDRVLDFAHTQPRGVRGRTGQSWGVGRQMPVQSPTGGKSFYSWREGAVSRNSTVSSDSHLEIGHWGSDQHHLVLSTVSLQFQGQHAPISLRPVLRIVTAYVTATV